MHSEDAYQKTLDYLYSFVDYSLTRSFRYTPDKFDLGRMANFVAFLGRPDKAYPIIHVAGNERKRFSLFFLRQRLALRGILHRVIHLTHLVDYTERIQLNGQPISYDELVILVK